METLLEECALGSRSAKSRENSATFSRQNRPKHSTIPPCRGIEYRRGGRYSLNSHLMAYSNVSNLISEHYQEGIGYPSLPLAFRAGMKFAFGGESGWWK